MSLAFFYALTSSSNYDYKAVGIALSAFIGVIADKALETINQHGYLNPIEAAIVAMWTDWAAHALSVAAARIQGWCPSSDQVLAALQNLPQQTDIEMGILPGVRPVGG